MNLLNDTKGKARDGTMESFVSVGVSRNEPKKVQRDFTSLMVKTLVVLAILQFPIQGQCLEEKGLTMKNVATKVAELKEEHEIWGLDFSPDGKHLAVTAPNSREAHVWDLQNGGRMIKSLEKKGSDLTTTEPIRYSPDGRLLVWCGGTVARIWNTETWELIHTIDGSNGLVGSGGGCIAAGFTKGGKSLMLLQFRLANRPGDNLIVYDTSKWQSVWGIRTVLPVDITDSDRKRANAEGMSFAPNTLATSPDGKLVAIGGDVWADDFYNAEIKIVKLENGAVIKTIKAFSNPVELGERMERLAWSPDGSRIAAGILGVNKDGGDAIRVFNAQSGEQVANEAAPLGTRIRGLRYTPDGKYLLEAGIGHSLKIWDGQHQRLLQEISESGEVGSITVSADGHYFAIGLLDDPKIQVWEFK